MFLSEIDDLLERFNRDLKAAAKGRPHKRFSVDRLGFVLTVHVTAEDGERRKAFIIGHHDKEQYCLRLANNPAGTVLHIGRDDPEFLMKLTEAIVDHHCREEERSAVVETVRTQSERYVPELPADDEGWKNFFDGLEAD